jgi:hypothetical protein
MTVQGRSPALARAGEASCVRSDLLRLPLAVHILDSLRQRHARTERRQK